MKPSAPNASLACSETGGVVHRLPIPDSDHALAIALQARQPGAADALFRRYVKTVRRVVVSVMNIDSETEDIIHEVFVDALNTIDRLREPASLRMWLMTIALYKARKVLRSRKRRAWLTLTSPETLNRFPAAGGSDELEAMRATYAILDHLAADDRIVFTLRFIYGMDHEEIAEATRASVATVKRRLARAEERFLRRANAYPLLSSLISSGKRWTS